MTDIAAQDKAVPMPGPAQVERAMRLTYAQMMLGAVFGASTGGMFLIGFALAMGADNIVLGLLMSVPMCLVVFQFLPAWLVERGVSRKKVTVVFAFLAPLFWFLIAAIPLLGGSLSKTGRLGILLGVICLVTFSSQFAGNARSSWLGELIPAERRGRFFGYCTMFAGIVGAVFAILEGRFLDFVSTHGLLAFTALFLVGAAFGLAAAAMLVPQPDCPLPGGAGKFPFMAHVRATFRNRELRLLAFVHAIIALGNIAGPFGPAYCLRDVGLSFFGLGLLNAVSTAAVLIASPFWGRLADRFGCRPVLVLGLCILAPTSCVWLFVPPHSPHMAYLLLPWTNFIGGTGGAGVGVAISTMIYKLSKPEGRSVQFATYSVFVTLVGMPMPYFGGWLVSHLQAAGYPVDLRITFWLWSLFIAAAAALAWRLKEPQSVGVRALVFGHFPDMIARFWDSITSTPAPDAAQRLQWPGSRGKDAQQGPEDDKRA